MGELAVNRRCGLKRLLLATSLRLPCFLLLPCIALADEASRHQIRDNAPAAAWDTGYPVGNGRLGATEAEVTPTKGNMDPGSMMY